MPTFVEKIDGPLQAVAYENGTLYARFAMPSLATYAYLGVPRDVYEAILSAEKPHRQLLSTVTASHKGTRFKE